MPVRNAGRDVAEQLAALSNQTYDGHWELVAVDNLSSDSTPEVLRDWQASLPVMRIVPATARAGLAYTRNQGARAARGDVLLFCDADDVVDQGWVEAMLRASRSYDLFGGRLSFELLNRPALVGLRDRLQEDRLPVAHGFLPYAIGANIGYRREVHEAVGGWDERYRRSSDDIDFCWRAQLAGFTVGFANDAVVHYRYRADARSFLRQRYAYGQGSVQLLSAHCRPIPGPIGLMLRLGRTVVAGPRHLAHPLARMRWAGRVAYGAGQVVGRIRSNGTRAT